MSRWRKRLEEIQATRAVGTPNVGVAHDAAHVIVDEHASAELAWRIDALRGCIRAHGPIWPPKLRNIPQTDTPGHCSLCGDVLPSDSKPGFPRCQPCVQTLWRVLDEREGVGVNGEMTAT